MTDEDIEKMLDLFYSSVILPIYNDVKKQKKITSKIVGSIKISGIRIDLTGSNVNYGILNATYDGLCVSYIGYWLYKMSKLDSLNMIYGNFKELSNMLLKVDISIEKLTDILFSIINLNIHKGLLNDGFKIGTTEKNAMIKSVTKGIKIPFILKVRQRAFLNTLAEFDYKSLVKPHADIMNHYLLKENFQREDLNIVKQALEDLGIDEVICNNIYMYLNGILSLKEQRALRCKEREERKALIEKEKEERKNLAVHEIKPLRTDGNIRKTLNTYFDFQNNEALMYLTLDEIIYCVCLLKGLEVKKEEIDNFIRVQTEYNREFGVPPIIRYLELRDKLLYYKSKGVLELIEIIKNIDEVLVLLDGLKTPLNDEDESFYSDYVSSELNKGEDLITYKREYESEVAATRQKEVDASDLKEKKKVL